MRSTGFSGIVKKGSDTTAALLLALSLLCPLPPASAVDDVIEYGSVFSPAEVTIGDRISYTVTVKHKPGETVTFALPDSVRLLPFVVIGREVKKSREQRSVLRTELASFDVGEYALPAVTVTVRDTSGNKKTEQVAPSGTLTVTALTDSSVTELLPIKPLKQPHRPWTDYLYPLLVVTIVITVLAFTWYFVRKRVKSVSEPLDPVKDALRKIRKLEKKLEKGMLPEECCEQLSFLIREYLEVKYHIRAFEEVTSEIEEELSSRSVPHAAVLAGTLHQADLVKFAESRPGKEECAEYLGKTKGAISNSSA